MMKLKVKIIFVSQAFHGLFQVYQISKSNPAGINPLVFGQIG